MTSRTPSTPSSSRSPSSSSTRSSSPTTSFIPIMDSSSQSQHEQQPSSQSSSSSSSHSSRFALMFCVLTIIGMHSSLKHYFSFQPVSLQQPQVKPLPATKPIPPDTSRKTVLVTGGAGFIGSHTAQALLDRGDLVVIIDDLNHYYNVDIKENNLRLLQNHTAKGNLKIYRGNICNQTLLDQVFRTHKLTHVCHLAARAGVRPSVEDPFIYVETNVQGTTRLLQMSVQYNITNFVYASSSSVYGGLNQANFSETEQLDHPWSPYAATKKSTELMAATYNHLYGLHSSGLRFFTVYGPRGRPDMAPYKFVHRVSQGMPIQQYGDGTAMRDFTFVADIVDGIVRTIDRAYDCEVFNLGRGQPVMLKKFIQLVEKYTGRAANIEVLPMQTGDVPYTRADTSKAMHLLGYHPQVSFEEGIRRTVEWYNATHTLAAASTGTEVAV